MIHIIITPSHILAFFFLLSSTVDAQPSLPPAVSPNTPPYTWDLSFSPVIMALICSFFFVGSFVIYIRHCSDLDLPMAEDPTGVTNNCCSNNCPQGIDPKLLNTFPILIYSAIEQLKSGNTTMRECAVCLGEFEDLDELRLLPKCNHMFHTQCIDAWLASNLTCPVCRSGPKPVKEHRGGENDVVIVFPMN